MRPDIEQTDLAVSSSKLFPKRRLASRWCKKLDIEAAWKDFQFRGIEATFDPALSILFGVNENGVELPIEPMHVTPRDAFQEAVLGKNSDVLREIGVINAARLQIEHFGCKQRGKSDRSGRADDDLSKFFPLNIVEHLEDRRETQLLEFILGQFKFADWREIFDRNIIDVQIRCWRQPPPVPFRLQRRLPSFCGL